MARRWKPHGDWVRNTERAKAQIRILIRGLMPLQVDAGGIRRALWEMAEESRLLFGVECAFTSDPRVAIEDTFTANHLYHIAREALHNAVKHSNSDRVDVSLELKDGELVLQVRDNGSGFEPAAHKEGLGIGIMRHRADLIDADLRIESSAGHGATVTCRFPAEQE